jgi:alkylation response protein AidB-like acyl-CoA dehydrogenase
MDLSLSEEQQQLKDSLGRYLDKTYTFELRHKQLTLGTSVRDKHWHTFAEFGLLGIGMPEQFGGLGSGSNAAEDTMVVMECFGRALVREPYLATVVLCGSILRDYGTPEQCERLLPDMVAGGKCMALAVHERTGRYQFSHVATNALREGDIYTLNGGKSVTLHGDSADTLIVSARTAGKVGDENGISLFIVDKNTAGVTVRNYPTFDGHAAAEIGFKSVRVPVSALVGVENAGFEAVERAISYGIAAMCAEAVGAMDALIEQTLEYLKTRKQFGVAIGTFQALQHRMVDMFIAAEQARSITLLATLKVTSADVNERRRAVAAAKSLVGQSARLVGQQAVQLHGGMGVTDELPISHYFKRLTAIDMTFGDAHFHRGRLGDLLAAAG